MHKKLFGFLQLIFLLLFISLATTQYSTDLVTIAAAQEATECKRIRAPAGDGGETEDEFRTRKAQNKEFYQIHTRVVNRAENMHLKSIVDFENAERRAEIQTARTDKAEQYLANKVAAKEKVATRLNALFDKKIAKIEEKKVKFNQILSECVLVPDDRRCAKAEKRLARLDRKIARLNEKRGVRITRAEEAADRKIARAQKRLDRAIENEQRCHDEAAMAEGWISESKAIWDEEVGIFNSCWNGYPESDEERYQG